MLDEIDKLTADVVVIYQEQQRSRLADRGSRISGNRRCHSVLLDREITLNGVCYTLIDKIERLHQSFKS